MCGMIEIDPVLLVHEINRLTRLLAEACESLSEICFQYDQSALSFSSEELQQWYEEHKKQEEA